MGLVDPLRFRVHGGQRWLGALVAGAVAAGLGTFVAAVLLLGVLPATDGPAALPTGDLVVRAPAGAELPPRLRAEVAAATGVAGTVAAVDRPVDLRARRGADGAPASVADLPGAVRLVAAPAAELVRALRAQGCRVPDVAPRDGVWTGPVLGGVAAGEHLVVEVGGSAVSLPVAAPITCPATAGLARGAFVAADLAVLGALDGGPAARVDALVVRVRPGVPVGEVQRRVAAVVGPSAAVGRGPVTVVVTAAPRAAVGWLGAVAVGGAVALLGVACAVALATRRERLTTLRFLGATGAQLRRAVLVELAAPVALGAVAGVGVGDRAARWTAAHLLDGTGTAPTVIWSLPVLAAVVVATGALVVPPVWSVRRQVRRTDPAPAATDVGAGAGPGRGPIGSVRRGGALPSPRAARVLGWFGRVGRLAAVQRSSRARRAAVVGGVALAVVVGVGLSTVSQQVDAAQQRAWRAAAGVDAWIQAAPPGAPAAGRVADAARLRSVAAGLRGLPGVRVATGTTGELRVGSLTVDVVAAGPGSAHPLWAGASTTARRAMLAGEGIVVTPRVAGLARWRVGDRVRVPVPGGAHDVRIVGVVDGGHPGVAGVGMAQAVHRRWFGDRGVSWIEVRAGGVGDVRVERTRRATERLAAALDRPVAAHPGRYQPLGVSDELRLVAGVSDALGWMLAVGALALVALVVAAGVLAAHASLATLVDLGLEPSVARRVPVVEPVLLAVVGAVAGMPAGLALRGVLTTLVVGRVDGSGAASALVGRGLLVGAVAVVVVGSAARVAASAVVRPTPVDVTDAAPGADEPTAGEGGAAPTPSADPVVAGARRR